MRYKEQLWIHDPWVQSPVFLFHNRLIAKIAFLSLNIAKLILGGVKQHARFFSAKLQLAKCCALTSILRTSTFFTCLRLFSFPPRGGPKIKHKLPCDDFPAGVKIFAGCGLLGFCTTLIPWKFEVIFGKIAKTWKSTKICVGSCHPRAAQTDADFRRF